MGDRIDLARFAVVLIPIVGFWIAAQAKNRSARRRQRSELHRAEGARDRRERSRDEGGH